MTDPVPASNSGAHSCCAAKHGGGTDAKTAKDPVCGMMVDPAATPHHASHHGEQYHFCSAGCRTKFVAEPVRYLSAGDKEAMVAQPGAIWTCPMHPEVRQDHPGPCPICGMALEPELVTADTGPSGELLDMSRRFWIAVLLTIPVFVLEMGSHLFPALHNLVPARMSGWLQLALATPVVLWAGWPFFERGWVSIRTRNLNMFTLIAMGRAWPGPIAWSRPSPRGCSPQRFE